MDKAEKTKSYLTTLTPLRGIAAIFVVMHHSSFFFGAFIPSSAADFFENSWIWVDFFFILSGFILSYSYGSQFKSGITISTYKKYLAARFARIYPLHLVTLSWAFAVAAAIVYMSAGMDSLVGDLFNLNALLPSLLLIQDFHIYKSSPLNFPAWSLSAEWWMYLIFPFAVPYFTGLTKRKKLVTVFLIIGLYLILRYVLGTASTGKPTIGLVADFGVLRCMAGFGAGMLLFAFFEARSGSGFFKTNTSFILFFIATILAVYMGVTDILIIGLFPFVLLAAAYNNGIVEKIFKTLTLQRLGDWSFSIYMVHGPIILMMLSVSVYKDPNLFANLNVSATDAGNGQMPVTPPNYTLNLLYCLVLLTVTLAVSAFTYRFIEVPAARYLKKAFKVKHCGVDGVNFKNIEQIKI